MYAKDESGNSIVGTLMGIEEDPNSRYRFEIWFDYTRQIMNTVSEGAMIAVPNYFLDQANRKQEWSSVLEIATLLPVHYAIAQNLSGFPGFLEEAARSAGQDWIDQENQSTDDTTKIRCIAIPTNLMVNDKAEIRDEEGMPMVGHPARLLNTETTERFANFGIDRQRDDITDVGPLIRDEDVTVYLRVEEALRTHFAVFGFTGAGKSNLLSTFVAKLLGSRQNRTAIKLVVFDLMGEFSILLMDALVDLPGARLLAVGPETLPDSVLQYYDPNNHQPNALTGAATQLMQTSLYPKGLRDRRNDFIEPFSRLLRNQKIRVYQERDRTIGEFTAEIRDEVVRGSMGNSTGTVINLVTRIQNDFVGTPFSDQSVQQVTTLVQTTINGLPQTGAATARTNLQTLIDRIGHEQRDRANRLQAPPNCRITVPQVVQLLNSDPESSLIVVQSADPDTLRSFALTLGRAVYQGRRRSGQISPLVSFIFDEADEFIPLNFDRDSSYADSTAIAMTLARRGRKFGLGIGIATQRVTYLSTSIMAQLHTYFISKLPRKSDRERVCEAFGISEDMFRQTFKFRKGNWLLVSHDATGLESVPLPIKTDNADNRILAWLDNFRQTRPRR